MKTLNPVAPATGNTPSADLALRKVGLPLAQGGACTWASATVCLPKVRLLLAQAETRTFITLLKAI
ncbi:hypothetical protein BGP76_02175 [Reichenbachiella sp. MSK19-1]|nr:hypothetical protein BGP76_02175 [Reichenbachiella sp. MSK19-1]